MRDGYWDVILFDSFIQDFNHAKVICYSELLAGCRYSPGKINRESQFYAEWKTSWTFRLSRQNSGKADLKQSFCSCINGDYTSGQTGTSFEHWPVFQKNMFPREKIHMYVLFSFYRYLFHKYFQFGVVFYYVEPMCFLLSFFVVVDNSQSIIW